MKRNTRCFGILGLLSVLLLIGTAGASDVGMLPIGRVIAQCAAGMAGLYVSAAGLSYVRRPRRKAAHPHDSRLDVPPSRRDCAA